MSLYSALLDFLAIIDADTQSQWLKRDASTEQSIAGRLEALLDSNFAALLVRDPASTAEAPVCSHVFKRGEAIYRCRYSF
jgi:hypothetical protein